MKPVSCKAGTSALDLTLAFAVDQQIDCIELKKEIVTSSEVHFVWSLSPERRMWKLAVVFGNVERNKASHS
jgi:hypothetical protein